MHPSGLRPVRVLLYSLLSLKKYSSVSKAQAKNFKIHSTSGMEDVQYVKFNTKIRLVVPCFACGSNSRFQPNARFCDNQPGFGGSFN